ncbi:hypothetical protein GJ496_003426 [Pomphorhynchus laevis]|nr:hypothetical protein GJ496_003426 [Pomphorhynchus laevis]
MTNEGVNACRGGCRESWAVIGFEGITVWISVALITSGVTVSQTRPKILREDIINSCVNSCNLKDVGFLMVAKCLLGELSDVALVGTFIKIGMFPFTLCTGFCGLRQWNWCWFDFGLTEVNPISIDVGIRMVYSGKIGFIFRLIDVGTLTVVRSYSRIGHLRGVNLSRMTNVLKGEELETPILSSTVSWGLWSVVMMVIV